MPDDPLSGLRLDPDDLQHSPVAGHMRRTVSVAGTLILRGPAPPTRRPSSGHRAIRPPIQPDQPPSPITLSPWTLLRNDLTTAWSFPPRSGQPPAICWTPEPPHGPRAPPRDSGSASDPAGTARVSATPVRVHPVYSAPTSHRQGVPPHPAQAVRRPPVSRTQPRGESRRLQRPPGRIYLRPIAM